MDPRKLSAQELLQRCCRDPNDSAAWEEFVRRFQRLIAGVVLNTLRHRYSAPPRNLVDDLVQETYLKFCANNYSALRKFVPQHDNSIYGFFKTVASRVVLDYFRRCDSDKHGGEEGEGELDEARTIAVPRASLFDPAERSILMAQIRNCLAKHASNDRTFARDEKIFTLYFCEGLTAKEISELPEVALTIKGVESALLRIVRLLRDEFGGDWPGDGSSDNGPSSPKGPDGPSNPDDSGALPPTGP